MQNTWNDYPKEKKEIKLKYLELLRSGSKNLRLRTTDWALKMFPQLNTPKIQFGGSFDHSKLGFFYKDHGFQVTKKAIQEQVKRLAIGRSEYIDKLIDCVKREERYKYNQ